MALVGAADPTNPALVLIVAFVAKNVQNGNRAAQEYLLDWGELSEHTDASERTVDGPSSAYMLNTNSLNSLSGSGEP